MQWVLAGGFLPHSLPPFGLNERCLWCVAVLPCTIQCVSIAVFDHSIYELTSIRFTCLCTIPVTLK